MGRQSLRSKKTPKKQNRFLRFLKAPLTVIVLVVLVLLGSYFAYKTIHYYSAPAEIKLIRALPIYSYESDTLKIVRRSEDYGGTDWKNVYSRPEVYIQYMPGSNIENASVELKRLILENGWMYSSFSNADGRKISYYNTNLENMKFELSTTVNSQSGEISLFINKV